MEQLGGNYQPPGGTPELNCQDPSNYRRCSGDKKKIGKPQVYTNSENTDPTGFEKSISERLNLMTVEQLSRYIYLTGAQGNNETQH